MSWKKYLTIVLTSGAFTWGGTVKAQELPKPSPISTVEQRIGLTDITIVYSRPGVKNRTIWGELVPYNEVWRTGANANTLFTTSDDIELEEKTLKAGTYSLFMMPGKDRWEIMFNTVTDGWGTGKYDPKNNVLTMKVTPTEASFTETMTMGVAHITGSEANVFLRWDKLQVSIPISVEAHAKAMANIKAAIKATPDDPSVYRNAARYLAESGSDPDRAVVWIDKSISIRDEWYSHWVRADIFAAKKEYETAISEAGTAIKMGQIAAKKNNVASFKYKAVLEEKIARWKSMK